MVKNFIEAMSSNVYNSLDYLKNGKKSSKTFKEVYKDVVKVISLIRSRGVNQGDKIGILAHNSYEWILVDLACYIGGYVSVAFSTSNFEDKADEIIKIYNLKLLFLEDKFIRNEIQDKEIVINNILELMDGLSEETTLADCEELEKFTIIFTSGTTSTPKAMEIKSDVIGDYVDCMGERFPTTKDDKLIVYLPFWSFPQRLYVYAAVILKIHLILAPIEAITKVLQKEKPTIMQGVPYLFESIYEVFVNNNNYQKEDFKEFFGGRMKYLITGSAPTNKKVLQYYFDNGIPLYETFGLTETGIATINYAKALKLGSVGTVVKDKSVEIAEDGEILISGKYCWAKEYLEDTSGLNERVFLRNGCIATGDIGFFDNEGYLFITGRKKEMIVLSTGHKFHPHLIEEELNNSIYIRQSAVFGDNQPALSTVIVLGNSANSTDIDKEIIRINEKLPDYARIGKYVISDQPFTSENNLLTSSMKLNKKEIFKLYKDRLFDN
ncbi:MAG: AMP-binding protein [Ruminiclostridium sp.]